MSNEDIKVHFFEGESLVSSQPSVLKWPWSSHYRT